MINKMKHLKLCLKKGILSGGVLTKECLGRKKLTEINLELIKTSK